ncbi:glycosyltransferase family 4 protein [bacterium]|nr:glycosyltransferase family 4 protein [bacterium]
MRILFIHQVADRSESSLLEWMAREKGQVTALCDPRDKKREQYEIAGAHVVTQEISHRLDLRAVRHIRKLCANKAIDVIYSSFNAGISTALLATLGLRTAVIGYRGTLGNLSRWDPSSYLTHLSPFLDGVVCNCPPIKDFLVSLGQNPERIEVIFKGHHRDWYNATDDLPVQREEKLVVGMVANMRELKGVDILIEAMKPLFAERPVKLVLIGSDKDNIVQQLVQEQQLEQFVEVLGFREDAAQLSQSFDIACMPSTRREGVPRSIVEAMSHGKPCVVSNIGGLPHIVAHERNGLVVPPKDPLSLREAIRTLLASEEKRAAYGAESKKRFEELFELNHYCEEMFRFFSRISEMR